MYHSRHREDLETLCLAFYLSLTRLSVYGFLGRRFIISDSAISYARDIAGTYTKSARIYINVLNFCLILSYDLNIWDEIDIASYRNGYKIQDFDYH